MKKIFTLFFFLAIMAGAFPVLAQDYVLINGIKWATRNVASPGTFTTKAEDVGMYYQWNSKVGWNQNPLTPSDGTTSWNNSWNGGFATPAISDTWTPANDPSPTGYSMPSLGHLQALADAAKVTATYTTQNGVKGVLFTDKGNGNSMFLPSSNFIGNINTADDNGYYWCSKAYDANSALFLVWVFSGQFLENEATSRAAAMQVRPILDVTPVVTALSPERGTTSGGTSVTIFGKYLSGATGVKFGSTNATSFTVNSDISVTAIAPAGTGTVDITVTTPDGGTSATNSSDRFTYYVASPPAITSFSPAKGAVGTTVTITGTNLNPQVNYNVVFFGATRATVNSASSTSLTVTVPSGATYRNISVTDITSGLTAYSAQPFITTFEGGGIDASSFAARVAYSTGTNPTSVAVGDLDGDGKPDLAVTNFAANTVSVFRNTSTGETISFDAEVHFATGTHPHSVAIGDIDGDGKPDLAVANNGTDNVSVLRNTSTSGTISFAAQSVFSIGYSAGPSSVAIGDIDGDGKPDLAVANLNVNTVSVFRNTSIGGAISFASQTVYSTGSGPFSVVIGDVDGDGKPDLAVANNTSNNVSILRNTSTSGSIGFAAQLAFTTGTSPLSLAIGDVDGDGKPDLAVANSGYNTVSVLKNTSTSNAVSFATQEVYTTGTNPQSVAIGDLDGDSKPDLAVANKDITVSVLKNTCTSGSLNFAAKVDYANVAIAHSVAIGDVNGDGKPDLAVANYDENSISVLRNTVVLLPPMVTGISPIRGTTAGGTSVTITGTNLSSAKAVTFGSVAASRFTVNSATSITATSPACNAGVVDITVSTAVGTSATSSADQFTYIVPVTDYVLINGVKWATRNVAAPGTFTTNMEDAGMFYRWNDKVGWAYNQATGSITPTDGSSTWNFSFWNGGYATPSASNTWTTANDPSPAGYRVPTYAEIQTLLDATKVDKAWDATKKGYIFTDKTTGKSIFGFASGSYENAVEYIGSDGSFWSSNSADDIGNAYILSFNSNKAESSTCFLGYGLTVRPVAIISAPAVTGISPSSGTIAGGTTITITGINLSGATAVMFGNKAASIYTVNSATSITATSPAESAGTVDITVTTTDGNSATSSADQFTYIFPVTAITTLSTYKPNVYPNPTMGLTTIDAPEGNITVYGISGKILIETTIAKDKTIDLSGYGPGIYMLILKTKDSIYKYKIVKQ
jgi:uncharacterized protein (TIGR02145 family)